MSDAATKPLEGDTYHCKKCDMSILVTTDCNCETNDSAFFSCCGEQLEKSEKKSGS